MSAPPARTREPLGAPDHTSAIPALTVPPELVEAVAVRAAQIVAERTAAPRPWLDVQGAAEYLACPPSRIYALTSKRAIPFEKDGSRTLFRPEALDEWVRAGGATRP